jgi:hypothetical protein
MMNLFRILFIALFTCVANITSTAQTKAQIDYNKEYNDILYLFKKSWHHLESSGASTISLLDSGDGVISTYRFKSKLLNREVYMDKIVYGVYETPKPIAKIKIDDKVFDIKNNNLKTDFNNSIMTCVNQHAEFCKRQRDVTHNQGERTYTQRVIDCGITGTGLVSENCAKTYGMDNTKQDIRRILLAYYKNKHVTLHWTSFMVKEFTFYTTSIVRGPVYTYSVTIFTEYKSDPI